MKLVEKLLSEWQAAGLNQHPLHNQPAIVHRLTTKIKSRNTQGNPNNPWDAYSGTLKEEDADDIEKHYHDLMHFRSVNFCSLFVAIASLGSSLCYSESPEKRKLGINFIKLAMEAERKSNWLGYFTNKPPIYSIAYGAAQSPKMSPEDKADLALTCVTNDRNFSYYNPKALPFIIDQIKEIADPQKRAESYARAVFATRCDKDKTYHQTAVEGFFKDAHHLPSTPDNLNIMHSIACDGKSYNLNPQQMRENFIKNAKNTDILLLGLTSGIGSAWPSETDTVTATRIVQNGIAGSLTAINHYFGLFHLKSTHPVMQALIHETVKSINQSIQDRDVPLHHKPALTALDFCLDRLNRDFSGDHIYQEKPVEKKKFRESELVSALKLLQDFVKRDYDDNIAYVSPEQYGKKYDRVAKARERLLSRTSTPPQPEA